MIRKNICIGLLGSVLCVPYGDGMQQNPIIDESAEQPLVQHPMEAAIEAVVGQFNPDAPIDSTFVDLLKKVAFGSYPEANCFNDDVNFRKRLAESLLCRTLQEGSNDLRVQKAVLICAALKASSATKSNELLTRFNMLKQTQTRMNCEFVTWYYFIKKYTDNAVCLTTPIWSYLRSMNAVSTEYDLAD
jgi:hypothetical protein